jgi:hypothetical protein
MATALAGASEEEKRFRSGYSANAPNRIARCRHAELVSASGVKAASRVGS